MHILKSLSREKFKNRFGTKDQFFLFLGVALISIQDLMPFWINLNMLMIKRLKCLRTEFKVTKVL